MILYLRDLRCKLHLPWDGNAKLFMFGLLQRKGVLTHFNMMYEGIYTGDLFFLSVDAFNSCLLKIELFTELRIWRELLELTMI